MPRKSLGCRKRPWVLTLLAALPRPLGTGTRSMGCPLDEHSPCPRVPPMLPRLEAPTILPSYLPSARAPPRPKSTPKTMIRRLSQPVWPPRCHTRRWQSRPQACWLSNTDFCSVSPAAGRRAAVKPPRDPRLCPRVTTLAAATPSHKKPWGSGSHGLFAGTYTKDGTMLTSARFCLSFIPDLGEGQPPAMAVTLLRRSPMQIPSGERLDAISAPSERWKGFSREGWCSEGCPGLLAALPSGQPREDGNDPDPHFAPPLSVCVCLGVLGEPGRWLLTFLSATREG